MKISLDQQVNLAFLDLFNFSYKILIQVEMVACIVVVYCFLRLIWTFAVVDMQLLRSGDLRNTRKINIRVICALLLFNFVKHLNPEWSFSNNSFNFIDIREAF